VESRGTSETTAIFNNVLIEEHTGFDRLIFTFDVATPGYRVEYVQGPPNIGGAAFLQISFSPATAIDLRLPRTSPAELTPRLPAVLELEKTLDSDGVLTWVVGLNAETDFRAFELDGTYRNEQEELSGRHLIVEVAHR
jgi:hypothetical protein